MSRTDVRTRTAASAVLERRPPKASTWAGLSVVPLLALGAVLLWQVDRPPILALVAAFVAVAGAMRHFLPTVVAAASSLIVCSCTWLGGLLVLGFTGLSQPLHPALALSLLLLPCSAWLADVLLVLRSGPPVDAERARWPGTALLGASLGGVLMLLVVWLSGRMHPLGDVAWALGGDARNQLLVSRGIYELGGLDRVAVSRYPGLSNGVLTLLLDTRHRSSSGRSEVLLLDFRALAQLAAVSTVCWCYASAGLVAALVRLENRRQSIALAAASLLPLTGVGLGIALRDGFHSVIFTMPLLTALLLVASWAASRRPEGARGALVCAVLGLGLPVAAMSWSPLLPVAGLIAAAGVLTVCWGRYQRWSAVGLLVSGAGALFAALLLLPLLTGPAAASVSALGAITAPPPVASLLVPLMVAAVAFGTSDRPWPFLPYAAGTVAAGLMLAYVVRAQPGYAWNYYPSKLAWYWVLAGLPLLLVAAAHPRVAGQATRPRTGIVVTTALSVAVVSLSGVLVRLSSPVLSLPSLSALGAGAATPGGVRTMLAGWSQPSAATAEDVVELGEREGPLVLWAFRDSGEDRLGNFWLSSYDPLAPLDGSVPLSPFAGWAYTYDATDLSQLCALLAADPARLVVTRDPAVEGQLASSCQVPELRVDVQPGDAQPTPP